MHPQVGPVLEALEEVVLGLTRALDGRVYVSVTRGLWDHAAREVLEYAEGLQEGGQAAGGGVRDAWRGRQNAGVCLDVVDNFFSAVSRRVAGGFWRRAWLRATGSRGCMQGLRAIGWWCMSCAAVRERGGQRGSGGERRRPSRPCRSPPTPHPAPPPPSPPHQVLSGTLAHDLLARDLDLPQSSAAAHRLLADCTTAAAASYSVY